MYNVEALRGKPRPRDEATHQLGRAVSEDIHMYICMYVCIYIYIYIYIRVYI